MGGGALHPSHPRSLCPPSQSSHKSADCGPLPARLGPDSDRTAPNVGPKSGQRWLMC